MIHPRLKSAQAELKEKEKLCKDSEHTYTKDKADIDAIQKEIAKIEVRCCLPLQYISYGFRKAVCFIWSPKIFCDGDFSLQLV